MRKTSKVIFVMSIMAFSNNNANPRLLLSGIAITATTLYFAYQKDKEYKLLCMEQEKIRQESLERERRIQENGNHSHGRSILRGRPG